MITVFMSGTWDMLHIGHVRVLERAATLGDRLIVGVVTDEFAISHKKATVIPYRERLEIVAGLRVVDRVVAHRSFEDYKAMKGYDVTIRAIGPDHGEHEGQKRGLEWCKERGIEVVVLERTPDISTTLIKEKIQGEKSTVYSFTVSGNRVRSIVAGGSSDAASFDPRGYSER